MKILICEPSGAGKLSHYTFSLCDALQALGHEVTLMTGKDYELAGKSPAFQIERVYSRRLPLHYIPIIEHVRRERPGAVHFQGLRKSDYPLVRLLRRFKGLKLVYTPHHVLPHRRRFYHLPIYGWLYRAVDQLIVHSDYDRESILDLFNVDPERIQVIPEGSYELYKHGRVSREEGRKRLGIPPESPVVLFFGYMSRQKGLEDLLRAFRDVRLELPESRLIVAGDPGRDRERYMALIQELGIEDAVIKRFGYIPMEDAEGIFMAADVVALPYRRAIRGPMVQLAYTFGRPVVATNHGVSGLVEEGRSGCTVPPGDTEALARAITGLLQDRERLERMSARCLELSKSRYSWKRIAEETLKLYG